MKPVAASFIVVPCGSIAFTFLASCGFDWIFAATGDTGVVLPVVEPVVLPVVLPVVVPVVVPLVVPDVVLAVRLPDLCDEPLVLVDAAVLPDDVVVGDVIVFPPWLLECDVVCVCVAS